MTDRELLELIASQVSNLTTQVDGLTTRVSGLTKDMAEVKTELAKIKATVIKIENDHGQKLAALFDGYKLTAERLDRIEAKVSKHEDIILKRLN